MFLDDNHLIEKKETIFPMGDLAKANEAAKKKPGRPPGPSSVTRRNVMLAQKLFQEYAEEARDTIVSIMRDEDNDPTVRLKAANDCLSRGFGTPVSVSVQEKIVSDETGSPVSGQAISQAGTSELMALAQALSKYVEDNQNTIDITPSMPPEYPD